MIKVVSIGLSMLALAAGWWFTTCIVILGWLFYGMGALLLAGARGGAFDE